MQYRREIDGLRAVAVVPVIFFHAGYPAFSGGYVGVDVFFVISGYLITTIILAEKQKGCFSLIRFYERRARRILPALFLVMFVSFVLAWLWMTPADMTRFSRSLVAVSTFSSNILFWLESGYWGTANEIKPLLHTWSLAVEEQFYVLFPLYLLLMWRFRRRWILGSFVVVAAISLVAAHWGAYRYPTATFFLLPTRAWELAIGAFIAFYFLYREERMEVLTARKNIDDLLGWLGLAMIAYAVFTFDENTPFPSLYALIPTVGTGLIIVFVSETSRVGRLLGTKALVGMGLISYSAYLWHQPLFAFARLHNLHQPAPSLFAGLAALSVALAYVSWRYVEKPFRNASVVNRKTIFSYAAAGSAAFLALGLAGSGDEGLEPRFEVPESVASSFVRSKSALACYDFRNIHEAQKWNCEIGDASADRARFLLVGDSHALALFDAFDKAAKQHKVRGYFAAASGCVPLLDVHVLRGDQLHRNCNAFSERVLEYVKSEGIKNVIFASRWTAYTVGNYEGSDLTHLGFSKQDEKAPIHSRDVFEHGLARTIARYREIGVEIVFIRQVPQQLFHPERLYYKAFVNQNVDEWLYDQSVSVDQHAALQSYVDEKFEKAAESDPYVFYEDPAAVLCDEKCIVGTQEVSYYYDEDHLSVIGARLIETELTSILTERVTN